MARSEHAHLRRIGHHLDGIKTVVDLGCGYGYLLKRIQRMYPSCTATLRGGDVSPRAVALANSFGLWADVFSFLEGDCEPLADAEPPVLVVTAYALHQLPSAAPAVALLSRYRDKIATVVSLEPEEAFFGSGLLGLLRHAYGKANDYSADLLRVLNDRGDVWIDHHVPNAIGANALLPGTISAWRFR
jgi:SAM-dependent methyltransferase